MRNILVLAVVVGLAGPVVAHADQALADKFAKGNHFQPHFFTGRAQPGKSLHSMAQRQSKAVSLIQQRAIARKRQRGILDAQPTGDSINVQNAAAWAASHR